MVQPFLNWKKKATVNVPSTKTLEKSKSTICDVDDNFNIQFLIRAFVRVQ